MTIEELKLLNQELFQNNISEQIEPVDLRFFLDQVLNALAAGITPTKENQGVAAQLVSALLGGAGNDANTLYKLRLLISALQTSVSNKENSGVAAQLIADLKGGVSTNRDTLKKLSDAIDGLISVERNVEDIAERNALPDKKDKENVYVANATGDPTVSGGWAIYKYILATTSWIKIAEGESIDIDFSLYAKKATGDSDVDYTPAESNNSTGFFAGLLTSGKLKIKAALDFIVSKVKLIGDLATLTTTAKTTLVAAINEVRSSIPAAAVSGAVTKKGSFNATLAQITPTGSTAVAIPAAALENKGEYYVVAVAGTYATVTYAIGDWIVSDGTAWSKVDNTETVTSVNAKLGAVVLVAGDIGFTPPVGMVATNVQSAINENKTSLSVLDNDQKTLKIYKSTNFNGF
jgi:hypothetical protein